MNLCCCCFLCKLKNGTRIIYSMWWCPQASPLFSYRDSQYPFPCQTLNTAARTFCIKQLNTRYFIWMAPGALLRLCFGFCSPLTSLLSSESAGSSCAFTEVKISVNFNNKTQANCTALFGYMSELWYDTHDHVPSFCNWSLLPWWWPRHRGLKESTIPSSWESSEHPCSPPNTWGQDLSWTHLWDCLL